MSGVKSGLNSVPLICSLASQGKRKLEEKKQTLLMVIV